MTRLISYYPVRPYNHDNTDVPGGERVDMSERTGGSDYRLRVGRKGRNVKAVSYRNKRENGDQHWSYKALI